MARERITECQHRFKVNSQDQKNGKNRLDCLLLPVRNTIPTPEKSKEKIIKQIVPNTTLNSREFTAWQTIAETTRYIYKYTHIHIYTLVCKNLVPPFSFKILFSNSISIYFIFSSYFLQYAFLYFSNQRSKSKYVQK